MLCCIQVRQRPQRRSTNGNASHTRRYGICSITLLSSYLLAKCASLTARMALRTPSLDPKMNKITACVSLQIESYNEPSCKFMLTKFRRYWSRPLPRSAAGCTAGGHAPRRRSTHGHRKGCGRSFERVTRSLETLKWLNSLFQAKGNLACIVMFRSISHEFSNGTSDVSTTAYYQTATSKFA